MSGKSPGMVAALAEKKSHTDARRAAHREAIAKCVREGLPKAVIRQRVPTSSEMIERIAREMGVKLPLLHEWEGA